MSNLVDLYNKSNTDRLIKARQIPKLAVDYFDREHKIADGFTVGKEPRDPTDFKQAGDAFDKRLSQLTPPDTFNPTLPLHRWNPTNTFYNPGAPGS